MHNDCELTRRELLVAGASAAMLAGMPSTSKANSPVKALFGSGNYQYELVDGWPRYPGKLAWGVGIVCDSRDRIYVHSRTDKSVLVFDRHGKLLYDFGAEFAAGGHGLYLNREEIGEFLYFCDHNRNQVVKTDLTGNAILRIGEMSRESPAAIRFPFNQPTNLAVSPNGNIFVAEGYGGNRIHVF